MTTETTHPTFIRVSEVWVPKDGVLVHALGDYGDLTAFEAASVKANFAKGEGLPGKAWAEGRPVVLTSFDGSYFKRTEAAAEAGLTSAVAVPVFAGVELKAVMVVLCGGDTAHVGAIEVWHEDADALVLMDGYYGAAQDFAAVSQTIQFKMGQGLPGGVYTSRTPILMADLGTTYGFLRAKSAAEAGLKTGLGIPVQSPVGETFVLSLLSSNDFPIARRFEIWDARPEVVGADKSAIRIDGICAVEGGLWPKENPPVDAKKASVWQGPVGRVLGSGLPVVHTGAGLPAGYSQMVGVPVYRGEQLAYVVAWYL